MENILSLAKKKADAAEVFYVQQTDTTVTFESNKLKMADTKSVTGAALRVIKDGRIGFSATTALHEEDKLVDAAVESSKWGPAAGFDFPGSSPAGYPDVKTVDESAQHLSLEDLMHMGSRYISCARKAHDHVQAGATIGRRHAVQRIANTSGLDVSTEKTGVWSFIEASLMRGTDLIAIYGPVLPLDSPLDPDAIGDEVAERIRRGLPISEVKTGAIPVIFTSDAMDAILLPLQAGLNGKNVLMGMSPVGDKVGSRVLDERVSVYDDPTIPRAPRSASFDGEGIACARRPLIESGVVRGFYFDLITAARSGKTSTGNGSRHPIGYSQSSGIDTPPQPIPSNLVFEQGTASVEDLIALMGDGLIVHNVLGLGQGNVLAGEFSLNVSLGYLVKEGKITGRVKNTMISGNAYDLLGDCLVAIGNDRKITPFMAIAPSVLFDRVSVSTKA